MRCKWQAYSIQILGFAIVIRWIICVLILYGLRSPQLDLKNEWNRKKLIAISRKFHIFPPMNSRVLAIPTDTCYGLACSFSDQGWYTRIYELKWREEQKPLALVVESFDDIREFVEITDEQLDFLRSYPYPFTLLARPIISLPDFLDPEKYAFLGLRVAEKCIDANIRNNIQFPLFLTSANKAGEKECFTSDEVRGVFGTRVTILWEESAWKKPSNVFSFIGDSLEREYKRRNY